MPYVGRQPTPSPVTADDIPDTVEADLKSGRKNLIINGAMQVWQRGTSFTKSGSSGYGAYTADRWSMYYSDTEVQKQEDTINGEIVDTLKITASASNGRRYFYQQIEDGSVLISGKTCTVSFWFKSSNTRSFHLQIRFNSGGFGGDGSHHTVTTFTPSSANTWEKFEITFSVTDTYYAKGRVAGLWIYCNEADDYGSDSTAQITQVQLELGSQATDFEHRSYGEELALCQRYYQVLSSSTYLIPCVCFGSTDYRGSVQLKTTMRIAPTATELDSTPQIVHRGDATGGGQSLSTWDFATTTEMIQVHGDASGTVSSDACYFNSDGITLDAEL